MVSKLIQKEIKKMKKDEIVRKNITLVFDFLRYLTDHAKLIKKLPDGCELEFLDRDSPPIIWQENLAYTIPEQFIM